MYYTIVFSENPKDKQHSDLIFLIPDNLFQIKIIPIFWRSDGTTRSFTKCLAHLSSISLIPSLAKIPGMAGKSSGFTDSGIVIIYSSCSSS